MVDFAQTRQVVVESQLRTSGVSDRRVLASIRTVPREIFVDENRRAVAYVDDIQHFGSTGRFMAAPAILAKLLQLAEIQPTDTVLDVGAGTGYGTAVIASMGVAAVDGLEMDEALAATARQNIESLGLGNASIIAGDGDKLPAAHYSVIFFEGSVDNVPDRFLTALRDGGRLVALIADGGVGVAHVFVKSGGKVTTRAEFNATLPALFASSRRNEFVF